MLAPLGATLLWFYPVTTPGYWLVFASAALQILYMILLGRGYTRGDLSMVYPIARGIGPMLVPVLAVLTLGEGIELPAVVGIGFIVIGIYIVSWWGRFRQILSKPLDFIRRQRDSIRHSHRTNNHHLFPVRQAGSCLRSAISLYVHHYLGCGYRPGPLHLAPTRPGPNQARMAKKCLAYTGFGTLGIPGLWIGD